VSTVADHEPSVIVPLGSSNTPWMVIVMTPDAAVPEFWKMILAVPEVP
jgi:hypothetical protein